MVQRNDEVSLAKVLETTMITINEQQVRLHSQATTKVEAIQQVGQLLVDSGCIEAGYVNSMLGREKVANTYLGNGITIPHGLPENRDLIKRTGIAVVQSPRGVPWNPGETAQLIVGIAAKSDEHIEVLRRLTRVLGDEQLVAKLTRTNDVSDIIEALTGERPAPSAPQVADYSHYFDAVVRNKTGLHARPASVFVDLAKSFQSDVRVRYGDSVANGKSLLELLQLGAGSGAAIRVSAQGPDATNALNALHTAIDSGLDDEPEQPAPSTPTFTTQKHWTPQHPGETVSGVSASDGLAIGPIRQYHSQPIVVQDTPGDKMTEGNRFQNALDAAQGELSRLYESVKERLGTGKAAIFRVHAELLNDASLIQQTVIRIYQGHSAAWSWQQVINERVAQMRTIDDPIIAGRAVDLSDVGQRVLRFLTGATEGSVAASSTPIILIADDLTPSDTAVFDPATILGFCTAKGGPTSHTAILARSLGIPAIVGASDKLLSLADGTPCILDGSQGTLYLRPDEADIQSAQQQQRYLQRLQEAANASRFDNALTLDGHRVEVAANINSAIDAPQAVEAGAEGVGLMRTELLFLGRTAAPSEEEQFEAYRDMVQAMQGRPLIIRTLDIGGDKEVPYLNIPKEDNAFLGIRGIRFCFARPDLFIPQLRALYRAAAYGPLSIMFPMIATLEDWTQARAMAEQVRQELNAPRVPLGIMIEVPSAAILADAFAQEVDFFSIGTNDLTQYTLAMDRLHPQLAKQADALHPGVLRLIHSTVQAAQRAGKWVGVCGGLAGDAQGAIILAGLGVSELSVSIPSIAAVKASIRVHTFTDMQQLAQRALQCRTAAEVRGL